MPDEPPPPHGPLDPHAGEAPADDVKRDTVVAANIGVAAGATAGIAATAGVMANSGTAGAAATTAASQAAAGAAAQATTGAAQVVAVGGKAGGIAVGTKVGAGLLGAALIGGAVLVGLGVTDDSTESTAQIMEPVMDEGITEFDFANTTITHELGDAYQLVDGEALEPGMEEFGVGYHLQTDPVFADIDGDNDLDAAVGLAWQPSAGATTYYIFLWRWEDGEAVQATRQLNVEYQGYFTDLEATDTAFQVTLVTVLQPTMEEFTETFTFGLSGEDVVRTDPLSAAVSCPQSDGVVSAPVNPDATPLVAPRDDAEPIDLDWTVGGSQDSGDGSGWHIAELVDDAGVTACGWVRVEDLT